MILKLRQRMTQEESGFTLVELLVVMLILGILAAIAIPAFLNQREKANDADAKADVNTAMQAMETYQTDHNGSYVGATAAGAGGLTSIEPALQNATLAVTGSGGAGNPTANAYRVTVTADSTGHTFSIDNNAGVLTYPCTPAAGGGGCSGGTWHP